MPDNWERRQEGTDDHARDFGDLQLGHAIYARHAHFPGASSVGSHIVRRVAQFNAGSSSLGQRLYRRWAGGADSGFSWPDMEWLHAYRGGQATATRISPQRTPLSGRPTSYPSLESSTATILRSTEDAPAQIDPTAASKTGTPTGALDFGMTPQEQHPIVSTQVDKQDPPLVYDAGLTPAMDVERKIETNSSSERQQGKELLKADANGSTTAHSKGPFYLGRAILQRSIQSGRSHAKPNVSGLPIASSALPAGTDLHRLNRQQSSGVESTKLLSKGNADQSSTRQSKQPIHLARAIPQVSNDTRPDLDAAPIVTGQPDSPGTHVGVPITQTAPTPVRALRSTARTSIIPGKTAAHRRQIKESLHPAESPTKHLVHLEAGESSHELSLDTPRADENTQAITGAAQPTIERQQSPEEQSSQSPFNTQPSNQVLRAPELLPKERPPQAIEQTPATRAETVHLAQAKTLSRPESRSDADASMEPSFVPPGPTVSSATQSFTVTNASDARRRDMPSPATAPASETALRGLPATRDLKLASDRPATVFRSSALRGSATPFTPAAQNFGANILQRHRESPITHPVDVGTGHNPARTVVQPDSALSSSDNRVSLATARTGQNDGERGHAPYTANLSHVASRAAAVHARSQALSGIDVVGDVPLQSGVEAAGAAREIVGQPEIQRESDSAAPGFEGHAPVVVERSGTFDGPPLQTHRIPDQTAGLAPTAHAHGRPQAAFQHSDHSAIHVPSTPEQAPRVPAANDRHMNVPSVMVSRSRQEARPVSPSLTTHVGPSSILPVLRTTSQEHDAPFTGANAGSVFFPSVHGTPVPHNIVLRSSLDTVQDRAIQLRPPTSFRSVSLTHRASQVTDNLQRSPATAAIGSHFLARQSNGLPAPSTIPAAVPLPTASSSTYQAGNASQNSKNVDIRQLANRVYELLVRRLATERQRRGI